jgi:hypothetical protein
MKRTILILLTVGAALALAYEFEPDRVVITGDGIKQIRSEEPRLSVPASTCVSSMTTSTETGIAVYTPCSSTSAFVTTFGAGGGGGGNR